MKKIILFALLGLFSIQLSAQIAVKAGVNLANVKEKGANPDQDDFENGSITGAVLGAAFAVPVSDNFSIQPELLFIQKGGRSDLANVFENTYKLSYLELPVLLRFGAPMMGSGFYGVAGPWAGYALQGESKATSSLGTIEADLFDENGEFNAKRLDYGLSLGVGFSFGSLGIDARYNYGINNLLDNDANNSNDNKPTLQTRGISLAASFAF